MIDLPGGRELLLQDDGNLRLRRFAFFGIWSLVGVVRKIVPISATECLALPTAYPAAAYRARHQFALPHP
jgi:hypothetical protein